MLDSTPDVERKLHSALNEWTSRVSGLRATVGVHGTVGVYQALL